jgi:DNA-binding transcriptional MerR regulator
MTQHGERWTIDELSAAVALALAVDYAGAPNGRVRDMPDARTIRYYTTLGLLDRPLEMRGRTALYGPRHLWQLVAIKRLQARGLSLSEVQQRLLGLPDDKLRELAGVPIKGGERAAPQERESAFWKTAPAPVEATPSVLPAALQGVPLPGGVTLLLPAARPLEEDDLEAIRAAAAPLLHLLQRRRLMGPCPGRNTRLRRPASAPWPPSAGRCP